ncbi:NUCLEOLAR PROTEIN 12 [Salix purpurea]|uniref:NUCLEOLAR PROTEIN 12 n=1 Tax=Salix purpurea TaxID=77065 RepID=A0A9Q1AG15_SALPP|nr:NUCLEOLAR PROTEIN 12 [Salix purpurea]
MGGEIEDNVAIQIPPNRVGHIKKRVLKNKGVSVSFSEKDLRDYVTGFHKRKKKRRKEAIKNQEEKLRVKRIVARKQRKLEKELALNGGAPQADDESDKYEEDDDDEESEPIASINGTTKYDNGNMQVTVTTSEISREDEDGHSEKTQATVPRLNEAGKLHKLSVTKKKSFKKVLKHKSRSKPQNKRDKKKGKTQTKKR